MCATGPTEPWPPLAHFGPKAMLVNGWSGSGGDCFPYYFQRLRPGAADRHATWGGLIGITGAPHLIDDGSVTVPTFGIYSTKGDWIIEGYGVDPDIKVVDDPSQMAKVAIRNSSAIQEVQRLLKKQPPQFIKKPRYPLRAGGNGSRTCPSRRRGGKRVRRKCRWL